MVSTVSFAFLALSWGICRSLSGRLSKHSLAWVLIGFNFAFLALDGVVSLSAFSVSVLLNFSLVSALRSTTDPARLRFILRVGILFNTVAIFSPKLSRLADGPSLFLLGLSYYSIQQIMALVDLYEERLEEEPPTVGGDGSLRTYLAFTSFFPQLTSGPICSWDETGESLSEPKPASIEESLEGILILAHGLFQKVVLSSLFGLFAHNLTSDPRVAPSGLLTFLFLTCSYLEVYFGFSGYTDLAIGVGRLFGVRLPLNFNQPLRATSPAEFWARWHMTLTSFVKNYIYVPSSRAHTASRWIPRTAMVGCMALVGIWHEPSLKFLAFGLVHGLALLLWPFKEEPKSKGAMVFRWAVTQCFAILTMVFWLAPSLQGALGLLSTMARWPVDFAFLATFDGFDRLQVLFCVALSILHVANGKNSVTRFKNARPSSLLLLRLSVTCSLCALYLNSGLWRNFIYADF